MPFFFAFSEVGDEAILNALWSRYENAPDKVCLKYSNNSVDAIFLSRDP